jgi:hypothetical protein
MKLRVSSTIALINKDKAKLALILIANTISEKQRLSGIS